MISFLRSNKQQTLSAFLMTIAIFFFRNNSFTQVILSPEIFGGKGDAIILKNVSMNLNSAELTSQGANFSSLDLNKIIFVNGAGVSGSTLISRIQSVLSSDKVVLNNRSSSNLHDTIATFGTDCTDAFIKMNLVARKEKVQMIRMEFKRGNYLTKFNNWLAGIKNVEVLGNGASIMCTNGAYEPYGYPAANAGLYMPAVFDNVDNNYYTGKWSHNTSYGFRINTSMLKTDYVTLQIPDSAINFQSGDWVLIYGFEQENKGGYPPDERYFEYAKIKNVDLLKGKLTLTEPLKNYYDSGWPDSTWAGGTEGLGAPRIINCNRPTFNIIDSLVMKDLNFVSFPGWTGGYAISVRNGRFELYGVIDARITNISCTGFYVGTSKNAVLEKCNITQQAEPDKEVENLTINNSNIYSIVSARGIDTVRLTNSILGNGEFTVSSRIVYVDGCSFSSHASGSTSSIANFGFNGGTDYIKIGRNTWNCNDIKRHFLLGLCGSTNLTVEKVLDEKTIIVSNINWAAAFNGRQVVPGHTGYTVNGKSFTITRVFQFAKNIIAIEGIFSAPVVAGDIFAFSCLPKLSIDSTQDLIGPYKEQYSFFADPRGIIDLKYFIK